MRWKGRRPKTKTKKNIWINTEWVSELRKEIWTVKEGEREIYKEVVDLVSTFSKLWIWFLFNRVFSIRVCAGAKTLNVNAHLSINHLCDRLRRSGGVLCTKIILIKSKTGRECTQINLRKKKRNRNHESRKTFYLITCNWI